MIRKLGLGLVVAAALLAPTGAAGAGGPPTVYVDDDDPNCGGQAPCYSSIQPAAFAVSSGGSGTVLVLPGYYEGGIVVSGNVTVKSSDGPALTTIDGGGEDTAVRLYGLDATIDGFTITGGGGYPYDTSNAWGVFAGIAGSSGGTIRNNIITGNHKGGIGVDPDYADVQVDITIEGNVVTANGLDPQLGGYSQGIHIGVPQISGPVGSVRIANNIVASNGNANSSGGGILVLTCCPYPSDPPGDVSVRVVNNTVYGNTAAYGGGLTANASDLQLLNNVFFANNAPMGSDLYLVQAGLSAAVTSNVIGDGQFTGVNGNISSNPLLIDPLTGNFKLADNSPAIDSGNNPPCPALDQEGRERPIDGDSDAIASCDIGAYEYCPVAPDADGDLAGDACDAPGTGNVDCSGPAIGVSSVDALQVLRHSAGLTVTQSEPCLDIGMPRALAPPDDWMMGDVNCSGNVNSVDALLVLRANAGLVVALPVGCPAVKPP